MEKRIANCPLSRESKVLRGIMIIVDVKAEAVSKEAHFDSTIILDVSQARLCILNIIISTLHSQTAKAYIKILITFLMRKSGSEVGCCWWFLGLGHVLIWLGPILDIL